MASIFGLKKIDPELARQGMAEFIEAVKVENLIPDERMVEVLRSWQPDQAPADAETRDDR